MLISSNPRENEKGGTRAPAATEMSHYRQEWAPRVVKEDAPAKRRTKRGAFINTAGTGTTGGFAFCVVYTAYKPWYLADGLLQERLDLE